MITTLLATIGLVLHLTAPAAAAAAVRQHARRRQEPRPLSTPQRHYDLVTIGAAVLAVPIVITEAQWFNHPLLIPAWATTGALLPCIFWWASGRSIRRRRRATEGEAASAAQGEALSTSGTPSPCAARPPASRLPGIPVRGTAAPGSAPRSAGRGRRAAPRPPA